MAIEIPTDLVTSAVQRLASWPMFQTLVLEGLIGTDAEDTDPDFEKLEKAWLFQGLDDEGRPFRNPEGSGTSVVVLTERTEGTPNRHNTASFPTLQMMVYTDSDRDDTGAVTIQNADRKCKAISDWLDRCFHLTGNTLADQNWPGLRVHSCVRVSGRDIRDVPQTQSLTVRATLRYEAITD